MGKCKTPKNITYKTAKRSGDHKAARNVKVNFLPITQSQVCSGSVHHSLLLSRNLLSGILAWNPLLGMFLLCFLPRAHSLVCSCCVHHGNLHAQSQLFRTCLLRTSRLLTYLEPTLSCSLASYIKVTFIAMNPLPNLFFSVHQGDCLFWNPLSFMFLPRTSRLPTFLKPTLLFLSCTSNLLTSWNPISCMLLHRTSRQPTCAEPTLSYLLAPYIKVSKYLDSTPSCSLASYIKDTFIALNPLPGVFLLCTSKFPTFLEPILLDVLAPYIKVTYFPGTYPLVCSCPLHQGYLLSWKPLSCVFLSCTSNLLTFLEPTLFYVLALYIKLT